MSGKDLVELLKTKYGIVRPEKNEYYWSEIEELAELQYERDLILEDGTQLEILDSGEDYSELDPECNPLGFVIAFHFSSGTRWLEIYGHYVSHDGGYYDGYREVKRVKKTVTVFEGV